MSEVPRSSRALLALAAAAVAFAAADTYVVVLALPDMMTSAGLDIAELQRAAPIVSGFLLGYVGVLPLVGRIADLRGRTPVLVGSLVVFSVGSVLTAAAYGLDTMVLGRFVQGVGAGGLVPATLALVADLWPPQRRGLPLGVVGAVQELGSVLGPLYGALVLAVAGWRAIFWLNGIIGVLLAVAIVQLGRPASTVADRASTGGGDRATGRWDWPGAVLGLATLACLALTELRPQALVTDVTYGLAFVPFTGDSRWLAPMGVATAILLVAFVVREVVARRPIVGWRSWGDIAARTDLAGAALLSLALAAVIVAFATADPAQQVLSPAAPFLLAAAVVLGGLFWWRQRRAPYPLVPRRALSATPAWGSLVVSFFIGAALIAALVDIPFFARITVYPDSQLDAALVLVRFLVALPVGAVLGGWLTRRFGVAALTVVAMLVAAGAFTAMAAWDREALTHWYATVPLVLAGLGFGVAIAPVNSALLASTASDVHGVASALLVVARMVGMLIGISALTAIGLQRFYAASRDIAPVEQLCPGQLTACQAYKDAIVDAGVTQLNAVFVGAAVCAVFAAALAAATLKTPPESRPTGVSAVTAA